MKHLKKFNEHNTVSDLGEDIASDLFSVFKKMKDKGENVTVKDFDKFMKERGADLKLSHSVMNHLVEMGFDFDFENDEEVEDDSIFIKKK